MHPGMDQTVFLNSGTFHELLAKFKLKIPKGLSASQLLIMFTWKKIFQTKSEYPVNPFSFRQMLKYRKLVTAGY